EVGEALEEICGGVGVLETDGRPDGIHTLAGGGSLVPRQDRCSVLLVERKIAAVRIVVRVLLQPGEGDLRQLQTLRISSQVITGYTGREGVAGAVPMFCRPFEGIPGAIE